MHILLTNDDGPPSPTASPYIASFVRTLRSPPFNHTVSVVIPSQQRSWIGKAHLLPPSTYDAPKPPGGDAAKSKNEDVSDVITPRFYLPDTGEVVDTIPGTPSDGKEGGEIDYWVLVPGTPAACAQLGIFHHASLFPHSQKQQNPPNQNREQQQEPQDPAHPSSLHSPIDLVISGPNLGRNTSAAFALSSGTLGGALEAAISGVRAIAVSFAFFTKKEEQAVVDEACVLAGRICERLCEGWVGGWYVGPETGDVEGEAEGRDIPDLYSVNVPLVQGISDKEVKWTWMLNQKWTTGSLYTCTTSPSPPSSSSTSSPPSHPSTTTSPPTFKWSPTFKDMWQTVASSPSGNDGLVVTQQASSVTPLKANLQGLWGRGGFAGVLKL